MKIKDVKNILSIVDGEANLKVHVNDKDQPFSIQLSSDTNEVTLVVKLDNVEEQLLVEDIAEEQQLLPLPEQQPQHNPRAAHVGPNVSQGKGNWFSGTTWG